MSVTEEKSSPGTVYLIDETEQLHNVKHSEKAHDVVLVPTPSGTSWSPYLFLMQLKHYRRSRRSIELDSKEKASANVLYRHVHRKSPTHHTLVEA